MSVAWRAAGPAVLALLMLLVADQGLDGIIFVADASGLDGIIFVADASGLDVVTRVPVTPGIARTIDAGLLAARHLNQREFRELRRWLTVRPDRFPTRLPDRRSTAPSDR